MTMPTATNPLTLSGDGLTFSVRNRAAPILDGVGFVAAPGKVTGLLGPNGSGKSTLLHTLAGALTPDSGEVRIGKRLLADIPRRERARTMAMMEQSGDTDTDLTVADVVALGRLPHRGRLAPASAHDLAVCEAALRSVGMSGTGTRRWQTLSGGERQRVQAARALAQEPQVLLLDEPTNHLDIRHQHELLALLAQTGLTVVVVLHDLGLAARYCDAAIVLDHGRVHDAGPTAEVLAADTLRQVFGVSARIHRHGHGGVSLEITGAVAGPCPGAAGIDITQATTHTRSR